MLSALLRIMCDNAVWHALTRCAALCFIDCKLCYALYRVVLRCDTLQTMFLLLAKPHQSSISDKHLASAGCQQRRWWCGASSLHQQSAGSMPSSWCTRTCTPITSCRACIVPICSSQTLAMLTGSTSLAPLTALSCSTPSKLLLCFDSCSKHLACTTSAVACRLHHLPIRDRACVSMLHCANQLFIQVSATIT